MATGVQPRDEDTQLSRNDLEAIQDAMKQKKFRDLFAEYCDEIRDPANQALYQKEMVQLEKERGYDIKFINPKGGYVIKTSVAGDRKAFINICCNDNVGKPSYRVKEVDGKKGLNWLIPYSLTPPREDFDGKKQRCVIYDVVFHPDTLRMADANKQFREIVNKTAFDGLQSTYNIHLDDNNSRFPKSFYKGMKTPSVIRKEDPDYKPPADEECEHLSQEMMEKLYPQKSYSQNNKSQGADAHHQKPRKTNKKAPEFSHNSEQGYTIPKYVIKQQKNVDFQEFTYHRDSKQHSAIPSHLIIEINLPLLSSTNDCILDVQEKLLSLISETPAKYKLNIPLPYSVNDDCGSAKFDKSKSKLIVTLPVIRKNLTSAKNSSLKVDSGVESEEYSGSQSDDECSNLIVELSSTSAADGKANPSPNVTKSIEQTDSFFESSLGFILPAYTHNVLDDVVAFTFHVRNTEPDSVKVKNEGNKIYIKFTSIGSGFVPVHYAAAIIFDENIKFGDASGEAWDNNVILQLEPTGIIPQKFQIGLSEDSMTNEYFDVSQLSKHTESTTEADQRSDQPKHVTPSIEVTNMGNHTNIVVSSNNNEEFDEDDSPTEEKDIVWTETNNDNNAKSILRKPMSMMRSYSESSAGDVASSMDYISSDCIPEESSFKKTVRFNEVIAKQFYRYNSSIEGQKKKNQRKKSKKRSQDQRKSESEAEDDIFNYIPTTKPKKPVLKQRRDSGLADTSDADTDFKNTPEERAFVTPNENNTNGEQSVLNIVDNDDDAVKKNPKPDIWESKTESKVTCENIQHKTDLYNPDKLNKGQYLEVMFKNDLIFDLDM